MKSLKMSQWFCFSFLLGAPVAFAQQMPIVGPMDVPVLGEFEVEVDLTVQVEALNKFTNLTDMSYFNPGAFSNITASVPSTFNTTLVFKSKGTQFRDETDPTGQIPWYIYGDFREATGNYQITLNDTAVIPEGNLTESEFRAFIGESPKPSPEPPYIFDRVLTQFVGRPDNDFVPKATIIGGLRETYYGYTPESVATIDAAYNAAETHYAFYYTSILEGVHDDTFAYAYSVEALVEQFFVNQFNNALMSYVLTFESDEGQNGYVGYRMQATGSATDIRVNIIENTKPASCSYKKYTEWQNGFVGAVFIKNDTDQPISNWNIDINFADPIALVSSWSAILSGSAPTVSATPFNWNSTIYPGQEINFGFQGNKLPSESGNATVTGDICK